MLEPKCTSGSDALRVPSTALETSGARVTAADLASYRGHPANIGLAEFMSFDDIFAPSDEALDKLIGVPSDG